MVVRTTHPSPSAPAISDRTVVIDSQEHQGNPSPAHIHLPLPPDSPARPSRTSLPANTPSTSTSTSTVTLSRSAPPTAVKAVVAFAQKAMGTTDVRIDPKLNQALWAQGIKSVPHRVRVKLERKRNDEENAKEKLYTYATHVFVPRGGFKGLQTTAIDAE
ncbi:hypothetical protein EW146_g2919 [Bondarzewia mesenterica]|uniref:60S ribosomal protein L31 n=1 Tax=Bondarzewia mesenterica TaxID=1095465 RepID=A0A4S4LZM8_9AGAM|nr:hypothetical protein EW146_g2919 [Bondarzewia mesenterica]